MPTISVERPKMSVEMWESLKAHILCKRQKRRQEQKQDEEQERHRREQELKRKRDAMTLEDIKDQLSKLEVRLKELKDEKHELFLQLKKVLNEDETRKKQKESELVNAQQAFAIQPQQMHGYHPYYMPSLIGSSRQPSLYQRLTPMSSGIGISNSLNSSSQVMSNIHSSPVNHGAKRNALKRPHERSPSPPPSVPYTGILPVYKSPMSYTPPISKGTPTGPFQLYYPHSTPQVAYDSKGNPYHILPGSNFPPETSSVETNGYDSSKYYSQYRGVNSLVPSGVGPSIIPIQSSQSKPGGITSGFPVQRLASTASNSVPVQRDSRDGNRQYQYRM
ncbi:G protein pathway suppressor 2-like protein [Leptotrombidium deliense]|uniref:G protein pathway suppressor 2-like protein n=1 Tax=Leptotrombidium deliense TaxID=299467 RepID=A0A443SFW2_9ACAR|nr:G protein pathway suppressor 2-like protein [Leptotrombidium deliense]